MLQGPCAALPGRAGSRDSLLLGLLLAAAGRCSAKLAGLAPARSGSLGTLRLAGLAPLNQDGSKSPMPGLPSLARLLSVTAISCMGLRPGGQAQLG